MPLSAVIFDLDGTLLDTLEDIAQATNQTLTDHGLPELPVADYCQLVGSGARDLVCLAFQRSAAAANVAAPDLAEQDGWLQDYRRCYAACWDDQTRPYPGTGAMLQSLRDAGLRLAILSNKPDAYTREMVAHYFAEGLFNIVAGQQADWPLKPDPALALNICSRLGVDPADAAFVGDSGSDMTTAIRAGMLPLGVLWGFRSAQEMQSHGAAHLFQDVADLGRFLIAASKAGK